jgi:uncharacterized membrane protein
MSHRVPSLALVTILFWAGAVSAQTYVPMPFNHFVTDVTADGQLVVGNDNVSDSAFYWRWKVDPLPTYIGGNSAVAVSDDGSTILGHIDDPLGSPYRQPAIWTQATGWVTLNGMCGGAYDLSADGKTAVGLSFTGGCGGFGSEGFLWTKAGGMQSLQLLGNGTNRASAVSADGSIIGGFAQGNSSRTPAYWQPDLTGQLIDPSLSGEVNSFTSDGSLSVGTMYFSGNWYSAFSRTSAGVVTNLGSLSSSMAGKAMDVSEDGSVIVGQDTAGLASVAWIWTAATGIVDLDSALASLGITGTETYTCTKVSDDGNVIIGTESLGLGVNGFIAEFNSTPWVNLGGGTAGALGQPVFEASGDLTAGSTLSLDLVNTPPSAIFLMWISLSSSPANVVGGTLYPLPADAKLILATNPLGEFSIATAVAAGAPSGVDLWFQCIVQDATNVNGITLSNAMRGTTP